jgi:glycosyltransferase involved in cell wall biosynthesis
MTNVPRISMIMPVYNGADYLAAALDSVLAQSFVDFELICLDDGSKDATPAILAEYAARDTRILHIRNTTNVGLPATLNKGEGRIS